MGAETVDAAEMFHSTPPQSMPLPQTEIADRLELNLTPASGCVEYADISPTCPGRLQLCRELR